MGPGCHRAQQGTEVHVLGTGASGDKAAGAGLGSGTGGSILPELSAVATAKPRAQGNGSASCHSPVPGPAMSKTTAAFRAVPAEPSELPEGSGAGVAHGVRLGARQPSACCSCCQSRRQSVTGLGSTLCAWGGVLAVSSLDLTLWLSLAVGRRDVPALRSGCPQSASGSADAPEHLP